MIVSRDNLPSAQYFKEYRKTTNTQIAGPYPHEVTVVTRNGTVVVGPGGYVAIDAHGYPYPVDGDEFQKIYELVPQESSTEDQLTTVVEEALS